MSNNKTIELARKLFDAQRAHTKGTLDQMQKVHRIEAINKEGLLHAITPNEILTACMNNDDAWSKESVKQ